MADIEADVIIVGAGISGALLAAKLSASGVKVAILEAGARVNRTEARQRFWDAPVRVPECPYPPTPEAEHPISNDPDYWYRQAGPNKFKSTYLKVVGGTTWHWLGTCLRFMPNDFRLRTAHGRGLDWPIDYDDLEPFYSKAEHEIGVAGDSTETLGSPRSTGYPMPAIPQTFLDEAYARALDGTEFKLRPTPQARNSVNRDGRRACCGNASCIPVCPSGAKYDATVHLSLAEKNGAVLHVETTATRVEVGAEGRVAAIHFKRWHGSEGVASGKIFVLAAHAIETPRLLLHSRSEAWPNGVANSSDQVGRNLMDHPTQLSWALAAEPVWPYRGPLSTSSIENFRDHAFRKDRPAMRIEIGNDGWAWPKGAPVTTAADFARQGLRGRALDSALRDQASRHLRLASQVEQLPDPENRVTLDPDEKDIYGVPLPRLAYRIDAYVEAGLAAARAAHAAIFGRLAATGIQHRDAPEGAGHIMGTARMGNDAKSAVVDRELRSHDHRNLFILGYSRREEEERRMVRVVGIDHLVISVGDFETSKKFYAPLMAFLGFGVEAEYEGSMMGWANGKTLFWIAAADAQGKKHTYRKGDIGFHHYAFRLRSRADVDALQAYLEGQGATIVDPAGEYYDDYYAVFFLDPDGMKLEGMRYGERHEQAARKRAAAKRAKLAKRKTAKR